MADMTPQGTQAYGIESGYERGDANIRGVITGLAIIGIGTGVVMLSMYGMFNVLNKRVLLQEAQVPVAQARYIVPPEPRLLPSPYTDEKGEAQAIAKQLGENPARATEDGFPWDKRTTEIDDQYKEANSYGPVEGGGQRIPIKQAMQREAGVTTGGSPATMAWMEEHPGLVAGSNDEGTMNLEPGKKQQDESIYDLRPSWESPDEKFTVESSGGLTLKSGEFSR